MILGIFSVTIFTLLHTLLSVVGIAAGLVVAGGLVARRRLDGWTGLFLVTTLLTNASGFGSAGAEGGETRPGGGTAE
jgi:hypothetical protein